MHILLIQLLLIYRSTTSFKSLTLLFLFGNSFTKAFSIFTLDKAKAALKALSFASSLLAVKPLGYPIDVVTNLSSLIQPSLKLIFDDVCVFFSTDLHDINKENHHNNIKIFHIHSYMTVLLKYSSNFNFF